MIFLTIIIVTRYNMWCLYKISIRSGIGQSDGCYYAKVAFRLQCTFLRTYKMWNDLPPVTFPTCYDLRLFKRGVIKFLRDRQRIGNYFNVTHVPRRRWPLSIRWPVCVSISLSEIKWHEILFRLKCGRLHSFKFL